MYLCFILIGCYICVFIITFITVYHMKVKIGSEIHIVITADVRLELFTVEIFKKEIGV